ncbi:protein tyrosine phosphatase [Jatrophihabitans endophyticus]|uniref:protein-tyrosine-phosphatase n=1 Tax=Jatrophihabitans endophyticus TaxID=1206085 RepID=A0A1M5I980_9ACTN|nr:low molecular weight protein-tyrosine-phosphatase [Jatrophihabitans endophyticus]SHG24802.1 protein tyrosine phosphatase [Jatrophihabitans endophyticus]
MTTPVRVVFVCSGNICRSPTAEVVLAAQAAASGRGELVRVASAGTGGWHVGDDMDRRSRRTLEAAGYAWPRHRARQFGPADFADHDLVVALDSGHRAELCDLADETADPSSSRAKVVLLREFDPEASDTDRDVADPYCGGSGGFTEVLAQIERSCARLLDAVTRDGVVPRQQTDLPPL